MSPPSASEFVTPMIYTKILATMGPACAGVDNLVGLFEAGVDVCRLNFSHGQIEGHATMLGQIREAAKRVGKPVAILGDLGGPKIRVGQVADQNNTGGMPIAPGDDLIIQRQPIVATGGKISTTYDKFVGDVEVGHRILIEDGLLRFVCTEKYRDEVRARCTAGGVIKSSKGVNLPNTVVDVPSVTDRDWDYVEWAIGNDLDYLALSFVRKADDLKMLRFHLQRKHSPIEIIAKIEKPEAIQDIDGILEASDGLMIARGDLGVEMDVAQVPIIQKDLIRRCQGAGKPVIVATQMLQSMVENASPTRAEVSDVANAIFDGTDAVMLSAETSVGKYPLGAVHTMKHVAEVTEAYLLGKARAEGAPAPRAADSAPAAALARGAWRIVTDIGAKLVVVWSQTGATAKVFSKHHFPVPIVALSSDPRTLRKMEMNYGVSPFLMSAPDDMTAIIAATDALVVGKKLAEAGDRIVIVAGWSPAMPNTMNGIIIHTLGEKWAIVHPSAVPASRERDGK
jgi:pyruvate kinase